MFGRLMPREGKYFDLFNDHAHLLVEGGKALAMLIEALIAGRDDAARYAETIDDLERRADCITHDTLQQLHASFITPFDRDEIHALINGLDDILDATQDVAESMTLYDIHSVPPDARDIAATSQLCCERVQAVVRLLDNMDNASAILAVCQEINELESRADKELRSAMCRLFREEDDAKAVIKLKEVYALLEMVTDRCKDAASVIEAIVLENS